MPLVAIVFGWPAAAASILLGIVGVVSKRWFLLLIGLIVGGPFLFYLSLTPRFGWFSLAVATSYLAAVIAGRRRYFGLAAVLFAPMILLVTYAAFAVSSQFR